MIKALKVSVFTLIFGVSLIACNKSSDSSSDADESSEETTSEQSESTEGASYSFQRAFTQLEWTAYKTTDRVAVGGSFKEFTVKPGSESGSVQELLEDLTFTIPTSSSFSNEASRDEKIAKYFYGKLMNTAQITGKIDSIQHNDTAGTAYVSITMNNQSHTVESPYTIKGNQVILKSHLILSTWQADPAVKALNDVCKDLHTGSDGVSKLWPDVDVTVTSSLRKL